MGWYSYRPRGDAPRPGVQAPSWHASAATANQDATPELADVSRMARRLVRRFVATARADALPTLQSVLRAHFGSPADALPVVSENWPPFEHVNVQLGLEGWLATVRRSFQLIGITGFQHRMFVLADLLGDEMAMHGPGMGSVAMANQPSGPGGQTYPCVQCGLYLVETDTGRLAILLRGSDSRGPQQSVSLEVMAQDADQAAEALAEIREIARERSVFRRQVLSFGSEMLGPGQAPITFHERPTLERDGLVLPEGLLEAIERHVVGIGKHRLRLLASGQHLKRGLLLHGPPGTGKTHTIRYLSGKLVDHTIVILSGNALQFVTAACSIARTLAPAVVVIEDVDLIAEQRGMHPGHHPMLFQLLNEMDGLGEDVDVTFVLTTNRADLLEPALAARPGRIDLAVGFTMPDDSARRRLLELYRGNLDLRLTDVDTVVARTEGVTASFLKELLRRAAVFAAEDDSAGRGAILVTDDAMTASLDSLLGEQEALTRSLLGNAARDQDDA